MGQNILEEPRVIYIGSFHFFHFFKVKSTLPFKDKVFIIIYLFIFYFFVESNK